MPSLYKITFSDLTIFNGGETIEDSKWAEIPDKDILCLEYFMSENESITLRNFESYAAITEVLKPVIAKTGKCPKCSAQGKISKATIKHGNGKTTTKLVARCTKCDWIGRHEELKECSSSHSGTWKYVMGLKNGIVTSYRITLSGSKGTDRYLSGDITKRHSEKGKEYRGKPVADFAWKRGIK